MASRLEWSHIDSAMVEFTDVPGGVADQYGSVNDGAGSGFNGMAVVGTLVNLILVEDLYGFSSNCAR